MGQDTRDWDDLIPEIKKLDDAGTPVGKVVLDDENEVVTMTHDVTDRELSAVEEKLARDREAIADLSHAFQYALRDYVAATDTLPNQRATKDMVDAAFSVVHAEIELLREWSHV